MRFYWLRCREQQKQFHVYWKRGIDVNKKEFNLADYPSKHHPTSHHRVMRPTYVLNTLQRNITKRPTHATTQQKFQRNSPHRNSTTTSVHTSSQQQKFLLSPRTAAVLPHPTNISTTALRCKGVLKPCHPNPRRNGIRRVLRSQQSTSAPRWHSDTSDAPLSCNQPRQDDSQSESAYPSKAKGCQPFILARASSHSSQPIYYPTNLI